MVDHLFRHEAGKLTAYLIRIVGLGRLELAEDIVQDALCRAMETWPLDGLPDNPSAWLMRVARNRAIDLLRRDEQFRDFIPEITHLLRQRESLPDQAPVFQKEIQDDQLRMMFSCCHPELATEAQVTLILKTLCGFSVAEIASALLTREDAIEKRLGRARKLFRQTESFDEVANPVEIPERLEAIYQAIYLLFNEGYHGSHSVETVRNDLCSEALRLALLLAEHPDSPKPKTYALVALLCFHAARLAGRTNDAGDLIQLAWQDRTKWDRDLIRRGFGYLEQSSAGKELSEFHLEAAIASLHCAAPSYEKTDWARIVDLYDSLYRLRPSPVVALNRAVAVGNARGPEAGLEELGRIADAEKLKDYPFYPAARGEFERLSGRALEAAKHFEEASRLARSPSEARFFEGKRRDAARSSPEYP